MLAVPWCIGWAFRSYLQGGSGASTTITTTPPPSEDTPTSAARAQVAQLSSPSAARRLPSPKSPSPSPTSPTSKQYPVVTQPLTAKNEQTSAQATVPQPAAISKTTATKTAAAAPTKIPQVSKQAQASPGKPSGPQVSSKTITLKMSSEWAQRQLEQFKFSFDEADRDKSGFLSVDEVYNVITKNGFKGSKDEAKVGPVYYKLIFVVLFMNRGGGLE